MISAKMVSVSANVKMSPIGLILLLITATSILFYFRDMIQQSQPIQKLSRIGSILKSQGYNVIGFHVEEISLKQLLVASIKVAKLGGIEVKKVRDNDNLEASSKGKTDEGVNDPVTNGDIMSHRVMYNSFKTTWPSLAVVSEEKDGKLSTSIDADALKTLPTNEIDSFLKDKHDEKVQITDAVIWIDPLDATKEYAENLREYVTTMVCVAVKGMPVIGVIHKPFSDETYWGWLKHGNNIKLDSEKEKRKAPWIIVSKSHAGDVNKTAQKAFGENIKVVPAGGAGYKVISLVTGKVDVYMHSTKIKKWDICAGNAILNSVSGKMTDLMGSVINYSSKDGVVLQHGLLATTKDHENYLRKLAK